MRGGGGDKYPAAAKALLMAGMEAQMWWDKMENRAELAGIVARRQWFNVPAADIINRIKGDIDYGNGRVAKGTKLYMKYWAGDVSYPYNSHDLCFLTEDIRCGKFEPTLHTQTRINKHNLEDFWREGSICMYVGAVD